MTNNMYIQKTFCYDCTMWNAISNTFGGDDLVYGTLKDRQDLFFCDEDWDVGDLGSRLSACAHCHCYCNLFMSQVIKRPKYMWESLEGGRVLETQMIICLDKKVWTKIH